MTLVQYLHGDRGLIVRHLQQGRILVLPVDEPEENFQPPLAEDYQPLMLLVLNSTDAIEWDDLKIKVWLASSHVQ